jgi:hypothetical protein
MSESKKTYMEESLWEVEHFLAQENINRDALREKEEMDPDQHDGSYELMRETIEAGLAIFPLFTIDDSSNSNKFVVQK